MKYLSLAVCFAVAAFLVAGCGKPKPEEYMAKAKTALDSSNYTAAIDQYEKLMKDHPDAPQANEAMFQVASIQNNFLHDYPHAIEAYKAYYAKYPQSPQAPVALFLIGYLYNNELHDLKAAKDAYEKYLATFPNHEMVVSAKFELENLGKKPEELLPAMLQNQPQAAAEPPAKKSPKKK